MKAMLIDECTADIRDGALVLTVMQENSTEVVEVKFTDKALDTIKAAIKAVVKPETKEKGAK